MALQAPSNNNPFISSASGRQKSDSLRSNILQLHNLIFSDLQNPPAKQNTAGQDKGDMFTSITWLSSAPHPGEATRAFSLQAMTCGSITVKVTVLENTNARKQQC